MILTETDENRSEAIALLAEVARWRSELATPLFCLRQVEEEEEALPPPFPFKPADLRFLAVLGNEQSLMEGPAARIPVNAQFALLPPVWSARAAWYLTGTRDDGIPMCQVLFFHWDELDHRWIEAGPRKPVTDAGILEQATYGAPVAILLQQLRGSWKVKLRFLRG